MSTSHNNGSLRVDGYRLDRDLSSLETEKTAVNSDEQFCDEGLPPVPELLIDDTYCDDGAVEEVREGWDNKLQFLLSVISTAVGLGNIWRFPYLCQQNGGGAFLIPYIIMMVIEGVPVFLIELGIGQRLRMGPVGVWNKIHPYLGGVGVSSCLVSYMIALYYNVILTWCFFYLFHCFQNPLPWKNCPTISILNATTNLSVEVPLPECDQSSETAYFWYREAIDTTDSIDHFGGINWRMLIALAIAWFVVWISVCKGIKTSGKVRSCVIYEKGFRVMYITATFPYIVMTIFLIRSVMLPGSLDGIVYMLTPQLDRLRDPRVWLDAAAQVFFSLGLAFGGLIAFASYNREKNNCKRDVLLLSCVNVATSMFSAIIIFAILGYKARISLDKCLTHEKGFEHPQNISEGQTTVSSNCTFHKAISESAEGTGLAFIVFAQVMLEFPGSQFWAVMFFLMLLMLGLGSMFGTLEGVITSVNDLKLFPWLSKPVFTGILSFVSMLIGLIFVSRAGEYWVKLFDTFSGSYGLTAVAFFEIIGVVYVYGWRKFTRDIEWMTGTKPGIYWQFTWRFVAPGMMFVLFVSSFVTSITDPPTYFAYNSNTGGTEKTAYPAFAILVGAFLVVVGIAPIPFVFFVRYFKIWTFERDIPTAAKVLNSTMSTAVMMQSQTSMRRDDSGIDLPARQLSFWSSTSDSGIELNVQANGNGKRARFLNE